MTPETVLQTEQDFETRILEEIDNEYHGGNTELVNSLEFAEESSDESIDEFKQWLKDMANQVKYPPYEGLFIRMLFRDFLYLQYTGETNEI